MPGKPIMLQGTGSSVGKSILAAALCRILKQDGYRVAPFKAQNMALNSYITADGLEMGRAQVVQAEACGLAPVVEMNPILLKPAGDREAQVIVMGKVHGAMTAARYQNLKQELGATVREAYRRLAREHEIIVIEGAGSPAEINLRERDLVNMGLAEMIDAPVMLVGDIDRGGVFAALAGTMLLLKNGEKRRVRGVLINKFRGDYHILKPGLDELELIISRPVLGVIPYMHIAIEDEDSVTERFTAVQDRGAEVNVAVIKLPFISNFTDFSAIDREEGVSVRYVREGESLGSPDILIIPGSKSTVSDLLYLRRSGLEAQILDYHQKGGFMIGVCGGYQMLGKRIADPDHSESSLEEIPGIGLLDIETVFQAEKVTTQVEAAVLPGCAGLLEGLQGTIVEGYEIHQGISVHGPDLQPALRIRSRCGKPDHALDGACNQEGNVFGTYLHGIFDNHVFLQALLNNVRRRKGLPGRRGSALSYREFKEKEYERLADIVRSHIDLPRIMNIIRS
ncbi:MAG: cobyric acid synthase [Bacillota bacterium]